MDRSELQLLLSRDTDGELGEENRERLERGLKEHPDLAADAALFRAIGDAVRAEEEPSAPSGLEQRILARVRSEAGSEAEAAHEVLSVVQPEVEGGGSVLSLRGSAFLLRASALVAAAVLIFAGLFHVSQLTGTATADPGSTDGVVEFQPSEELRQVLDEQQAQESEEHGGVQDSLLRWFLENGGGDRDE